MNNKAKSGNTYKEYWEKNIDRWGELYLDISHGNEELLGPKFLTYIYNRLVVPLESRLMKSRYDFTIAFLDKYLEGESVFCDVGCGTGVFSVKALDNGAAKVISVDIANASLEITKKNIAKHVYDKLNRVEFLLRDIQSEAIPKCDVALLVGVLPYIRDIKRALANILPYANTCFMQYSSSKAPSNILRNYLPSLNVRNLQFHNPRYLESIVSDCGHSVIERKKFATGYLLTTRKRDG